MNKRQNIYQSVEVVASNNVFIKQNIFTEYINREKYPIRYHYEIFFDKNSDNFFTLLAIWNSSKLNISENDIEKKHPLTIFFEKVLIKDIKIIRNTKRSKCKVTKVSDFSYLLKFNVFESEDYIFMKIIHEDVKILSHLFSYTDITSGLCPAPVYASINHIDCLLRYKGEALRDNIYFRPSIVKRHIGTIIAIILCYPLIILIGVYLSSARLTESIFELLTILIIGSIFGLGWIIANAIKSFFVPPWRIKMQKNYKKLGGKELHERYFQLDNFI